MSKLVIKNARIINEDSEEVVDILIKNEKFELINPTIGLKADREIDLEGKLTFPGLIDDQVHFREPGLTHKADIQTESIAAISGGVTSYLEMPNTIPFTETNELLEQKYNLAKNRSASNYGFYLGATNSNLEQLKRVNPKRVPGIKVFMGSSTGNLLVDDYNSLREIFSSITLPIVTHCEEQSIIDRNLKKYQKELNFDVSYHPIIRSRDACISSTKKALELAKSHNTKLHVLHLSTAEEIELFDDVEFSKQKQITSEVCIHHLFFSEIDYQTLGKKIQWNPAIKTLKDKEALQRAISTNKIDIIATDHAPHCLEEKLKPYPSSPSGGPLIEHSLMAMLELVKQEKLTLKNLVKKYCHNPALRFSIKERGFIREGYYADLVVIEEKEHRVKDKEVLTKCGWSPFNNKLFGSSVFLTLINGEIAFQNGFVVSKNSGKELEFEH